MSRGLFVTATGTDVGKTWISGLLVKKLKEAGLRAGYYKAALSGAERRPDGTLLAGDEEHVVRTAGLEPQEHRVSFVYERAVSPHLAARLEGGQVELARVKEDWQALCRTCDLVTAEGSGGIVCPLRWEEKRVMLTDVIRALGLGLLVVAPAELGSINSAVLTVGYARREGFEVRGIVLNRFKPGDGMQEDNARMIEALCGVPVLDRVREGALSLGKTADFWASLYA